MSVIDVDKLIAPVSAEAPAGVDVEYDQQYLDLDKLAQGTPEAVMGDKVKPAEEPDWGEVKSAALALFGRTRDLRVALILTVALLKTDGVTGFRDGVAVVRGFVEKLWDNFYPKLDPEDNNDPTIRMNMLRGLAGNGLDADTAADLYKTKLRLREATLTNSKQKIGRFGYRDIQIAKGELPPPAGKPGESPPKPPEPALIGAAFEDTPAEDLQATQKALEDTRAQIAGLDAALGQKVAPGVGPDFGPLKDVVKRIKGVVDEQLAKRGLGQAPAEGAGPTGGEAKPAGGGVAVSGEIATRGDVVRMLDKICEYYARFEPTSPVPIFMQRAKRLVGMNFVDLIKDLAPEAMDKIGVFTGEPGEDGKASKRK